MLEALPHRPSDGTGAGEAAAGPLSLTLRFLMELASLAGFGFWAWHAAPDGFRWPAALALPVVVAAAWGVFAVPGDPSRSGRAPVPTPGPARLLLELLVFSGSAAALAAAGATTTALVFAIVLVLYHATEHARIRWLLRAR